MQRPATQTPTTTQSDSTAHRVFLDPRQQRSPASMATTAQPSVPFTLPHIGTRDQRPTLPPLTDLESAAGRRTTSPLTTPPISRSFRSLDPFSRSFGSLDPFSQQPLPLPSPTARNTGADLRYPTSSLPTGQLGVDTRDTYWHNQPTSNAHDTFDNRLKRSFETMTQPQSRYPPPAIPTPTSSDPRFPWSQPGQAQLPPSSRSSYSDASTPSQSHSVISSMGQGTAQEARSARPVSNANRLSLMIRQQPRAARAGPDGKDRRAIDPPPVLQLMIDDFDIDDENDMNELRSSYFVVHCRLVSPTTPPRDVSTVQILNEDGSDDVQRLLLGTTVASPFFCQDDPDPVSMPTHPVTNKVERPPSPSSRFIQSRSQAKGKEKSEPPKTLPGSFFIFADLSVRKAGEYRLEFNLFKIEASSLIAGRTLPIIHAIYSQPFRVVNAKDFDQVQPSTELVKGLLDRGAGFPLKLKKGIREGQRRRQAQGETSDDDDDEEAS